MQNCKWKTKWVTLGIAVIVLAGSLAPSKAQAQENFAWITNTNGVTWKREIDGFGQLHFPQLSLWGDARHLERIAEIVVPEHASISLIHVWGCVNLTNIILHIDKPQTDLNGDERALIISAGESGLRNITCKQTMRGRIILWGDASFHEGEWAILQRPVQWTELPKMEIKTHATANGKEMEIVWGDGTLQIAAAVSGEWKDYNGNSPLRIPLWLAKPQQFFRIKKRIESPTTEEPPTPQTLGGNR